LLLLTLICATAWAQPQPPGISGTITNGVSGEPILRAHVMLRAESSDTPMKYGALTTAEGKFSISPLPPGVYTVTVEKPGFVPAPNQWGSTYLSLKVKEGDAASDLKLKLLPQAVISGRVLDADGRPVEHMRVETARGRSAASTTTNARGEFRLSGLRPGRYLVRAMPPEGGPPEIRTDGTKEINYGITYYPGAPVESSATGITARAGAEMAAIDIHLTPTPITRVSGVVVGLPAGAKGYVLSRTYGPGFREGYTTSMLTDPHFTLWRLPPGKYRLSAWCEPPGGAVHTSSVEVELGGANIDNIELSFVPPFAVAGSLEGDLPPPENSPKRTVTLRSVGPGAWTSKPADIGPDGAFRVEKVHPDRYRVELHGLPAAVYVKSVRMGQAESPGNWLDLSRGPASASLTVSVAVAKGSLSGTVQGPDGPASGLMVGLYPDASDGLDELRTVLAEGGKYSFTGVPTGSYRVFAFDPADLTNLKDGIGLEWYEKAIESVDVTESPVTKDVRAVVEN
jgi:hypothetical protein